MKDLSGKRGASALVLSGELTEGTSDLSQAWTAPGGVPAMREVNQDRSHPDAPLVEEQPAASYRRIVNSGGGNGGASWTTVSPGAREGHMPRPGPATRASAAGPRGCRGRGGNRPENRPVKVSTIRSSQMAKAPSPITSPPPVPGQPYDAGSAYPGDDGQSVSEHVYDAKGGSGADPWPKINEGGAIDTSTGKIKGGWPGNGASDGGKWKST